MFAHARTLSLAGRSGLASPDFRSENGPVEIAPPNPGAEIILTLRPSSSCRSSVHAASRRGRPVRRWMGLTTCDLGETNAANPAGSIGTLTAIAQVCQRGEPIAAGARQGALFRACELGTGWKTRLAVKLIRCGSPCTNPTSRKTPAQFCAYARAWASKRTLSGRQAFQPPIAPFAARAWTISMRSR